MILADTSVWVDHFRHGNAALKTALDQGEVALHPMTVGELACGHLPKRTLTLQLLRSLPALRQVPDDAVLATIESLQWWSTGIGWVDAHLIASSLAERVPLWTLDRRFSRLYAAMKPRQ